MDALSKARIAQDAAETAIEDTNEHLIEIENDLDMVGSFVTVN